MIELMFEKEAEKILIIIKDTNIYFGNTGFGVYLTTIEGLQLSYEGVLKEHPDLKENPLWRSEAIKRFLEKIKSFDTENERADYIIGDLRKHGFIPLLKQKQGFRPERIK